MAAICIPFLRLVARYRIQDAHKLPRTGSFVLAPNHYTEIDPVVVGYFVWKLGRAPRFFAKASLFRAPVVGWFLRVSGQIPIERSGGSRATDPIGAAARLAEDDLAIVIYPEGTLTRDPEMWPMRGKTGAVRTALEHNIPLIPAAHWGAQDIMPRYSKRISLFPRKTVTLIVGDPVNLDEFRGKPLNSASLAAATALLMDEITRLLERLRNEPAPTERWDPIKQHQKETGRFE